MTLEGEDKTNVPAKMCFLGTPPIKPGKKKTERNKKPKQTKRQKMCQFLFLWMVLMKAQVEVGGWVDGVGWF
jgi:hypothetical protein